MFTLLRALETDFELEEWVKARKIRFESVGQALSKDSAFGFSGNPAQVKKDIVSKYPDRESARIVIGDEEIMVDN